MKIVNSLLLFIIISLTLFGCSEQDILKQVYNDLEIVEDLDNITEDINLPSSLYDVKIIWQTSDANVISSYGNVMRATKDKVVILTATFEFEGRFLSKDFVLNVLKQNEKTKLEYVNDSLSLPEIVYINSTLPLPSEYQGVLISWRSSRPNIITSDGFVNEVTSSQIVMFTATLSYEGKSVIKDFIVTVEPIMSDSGFILKVINKIIIPQMTISNITLITSMDDVSISWSSSHPSSISESGNVTQLDKNVDVIITGEFTYNDKVIEKEYFVTVLGLNDEKTPIQYAYESLNVIERVLNDITLINKYEDVDISWESSQPDYLSESGIVNRISIDVDVVLTATLQHEDDILVKQFFVTVVAKNTNGGIELSGYYKSASGLTGIDLKKALNNIIDDHRTYSYTAIKDVMKRTDEDPDNSNNIILMYTGLSVYKTSSIWNREHTWPKSHGDFGTRQPEGTDGHHLRPTLMEANSIRGNLDFDNGGNVVSKGVTYAPGSSFSYYDSDSFEPRDEVKGDVARMMFYMAVRYDNQDNYKLDLELNDNVNNGSRPYLGRISALLAWHIEDPVDSFESNRNEVLYDSQNNRNPFVDYPEFVEMIWGTPSKFNLYSSLSDRTFDISEMKFNYNCDLLFKKEENIY